MNSFYFDKMHMLYNKNKSCVKSCQKTLLFKNKTKHCFPKKTIVFQHVHFKSHCFETKNFHCINRVSRYLTTTNKNITTVKNCQPLWHSHKHAACYRWPMMKHVYVIHFKEAVPQNILKIISYTFLKISL